MSDDEPTPQPNADQEPDPSDRGTAPLHEPPAGSEPPASAVAIDPPEAAVGAYLLDALSDAERAEFEAYAASALDTRIELAQLAQVVALLPRMLDLEDTVSTDAIGVPSPELRDRVMTQIDPASPVASTGDAVQAEVGEPTAAIVDPAEAPTVVSVDADEQEAESDSAGEPLEPPTSISSRPQGRIRSGVATAPGQPAPTPVETLARAPRSWIVAASLAVVAVGAAIWALALVGRVDDQRQQIKAQQTVVAQLRERGNATAFVMSPTEDGPDAAAGTLFYSFEEQQGILRVSDLQPLPEGRVYQVWYVVNGVPAPTPGATFSVDKDGNGLVAVTPDAPAFDVVALTEEPAGGSQAPTTPILLAGARPGAAG